MARGLPLPLPLGGPPCWPCRRRSFSARSPAADRRDHSEHAGLLLAGLPVSGASERFLSHMILPSKVSYTLCVCIWRISQGDVCGCVCVRVRARAWVRVCVIGHARVLSAAIRLLEQGLPPGASADMWPQRLGSCSDIWGDRGAPDGAVPPADNHPRMFGVVITVCRILLLRQ